MERKLIAELNTRDSNFGYNIREGGDSGPRLFGQDNPNFGKPRSETHCKHLSEALKGHKTSDETRKKISESNKMSRKVLCKETNRIYQTISEAAKDCGVSVSAICRVLHGNRHTSGGFHWQYA